MESEDQVKHITMYNKTTTCRCCGDRACFLQMGELIKLQVSYFECNNCGYVQTETPYWLDKAYASVINYSDTGILARNQTNARIVMATLLLIGERAASVIDFAGGYGILVRLLRDFGIQAFWADRYCQNLLANGFEYKNQKAALITTFEAFEHFINPAEELDQLLAIAPNVLISTELMPSPTPKIENWWYYGQNHGQHIGFFRAKTLRKLALDRGKYFYTDNHSYHLISSRRFNPMFWKIAIRLNKYATLFCGKSLTERDHLETIQKNAK